MSEQENQAAQGSAAADAASKAASSVDAAAIASVRAAWAVAKPDRPQFSEVVQLLATLREEGNGSVFRRGPHVQASHFGFFKPEVDAFYQTLQRKDRRSAKEWEYINAAGAWADMATTMMVIAKNETGTQEQFAARLALVEKAIIACREVLAMRADYFRDIVDHGIGIARHYANTAEQSVDVVFSETHRTLRDAVAARIELESAKILAKAHLGSSSKKKDGDQSE